MTKTASQEKKQVERKTSSEIKISRSAGTAIVQLVDELMKIDQYEQNQKEAAYKSFQNGQEILLMHLMKSGDGDIARRRQEIIKEIERIVTDGR